MHLQVILSSLLPAALALAENQRASPELVPLAFDPLPLGSIKPNGWLRTELETSAAGLGGHLYDFWRFVEDSSWIGGDTEYSVLNEALPYWVNAIVPLSYTIDDERLKNDVHRVVDTIIDRIQSDGWIGPETRSSGKRLIWARTLLFLGWTNLVDANATYEKPIVDAMHDFNGLMNSMLRDNGTGMIYHEGDPLSPADYTWFRTRVEDMFVSLQWLLERYPGDQSDLIRENIDLIHHFGYKWEGWYTEQSYIKQDLYNLPPEVTDEQWPFLHGVTVAEGLKYAVVLRRSTHNDSLLTTAKNGVDWTFKYHGSASGTILADERLDGLNAYYGSELCTDVEAIYSLAYNYFAIGDPEYADRAERTAFNALPAAVSGDWWSHQYMTEPNQPFSKNLSTSPFYNTNTLGQTFGLEPNYPCCTVNHPQGYPKFAMYSFVRKGEKGLVHALLSPAHLETKVGGSHVSIDCQTNYPFDSRLSYTIQSEAEFDLYLREPIWSSGATIKSPNTTASPFDQETRLHRREIPSGSTSLVYDLPMTLRTESRANDTVAVYRGPLLYALYIPPIMSSGPPKFYSNQSTFPEGTYPPQAHDYTMLNSTEWNVAIDPSTLTYRPGSFESGGGGLPSPTWEDGQLDMAVTAKGCLIDWPLFRDVVPGNPVLRDERVCRGDVFEVALRPYGSSKLHMSDLPVIEL